MSIGSEAITYNDLIVDNFFLYNTNLTMSLIFVTFLFFIVACIKDIKKSFNFNRKIAVVLAIFFVLGFWVRNSHYSLGMHTDGWVYAESAKYMLLRGIYVKDCAIGNLESCRLYEQVLAPPGYPFLISLAYQIFGVNSYFAGVISGVLSSLTILLIFFIAKELFDENTALLAAIIFSFFPYDLLFAGSGHARPASLFFVSFALFLYLLAIKKNNLRLWSATALTLSMAVYIRQENIVLLLPMLSGLFIFNYFNGADFTKRSILEKAKIFSKKIAIPAFLFILTQLPIQMWVVNSKYAGNNLLEAKAVFLSAPKIFGDLLAQKQILGYSYVFPFLYNPLVSISFLAGLIFLFGQKRNSLVFAYLLFISYFIVFSAYFASAVPQAQDYIRYSHHLVLPVTLISAFVLSSINKSIFKREFAFLFVIGVLLIITSGIRFEPMLFADLRTKIPTVEAEYFKAVAKTPSNCTIATTLYLVPVNDAVPNNHRRTINIWLADFAKDQMLKEIEDSNCVIFFEDWLCTTSFVDCGFIQELKKEKLFDFLQGSASAYRIK